MYFDNPYVNAFHTFQSIAVDLFLAASLCFIRPAITVLAPIKCTGALYSFGAISTYLRLDFDAIVFGLNTQNQIICRNILFTHVSRSSNISIFMLCCAHFLRAVHAVTRGLRPVKCAVDVGANVERPQTTSAVKKFTDQRHLDARSWPSSNYRIAGCSL